MSIPYQIVILNKHRHNSESDEAVTLFVTEYDRKKMPV